MSQSKLDKALQYLVESHHAEWANEYGEPGYAQPARGVILANWNNIPEGLADWLEKCGYSLEWSDEWAIPGNGKAYRTEPDCWDWRPQLLLSNDGEWITPDDGARCAIEECAMTDQGHAPQMLPQWVSAADLTEEGFTIFQDPTDDPQKIAREAFDQGAESVVFRNSQSQVYHWECWALFPCPEFERFDICAAYARIESDYNVGGWLHERASNVRRNESTAVQLSRMQYRPGLGGGMTPNAWAIYRTLAVRYGFEGGAL